MSNVSLKAALCLILAIPSHCCDMRGTGESWDLFPFETSAYQLCSVGKSKPVYPREITVLLILQWQHSTAFQGSVLLVALDRMLWYHSMVVLLLLEKSHVVTLRLFFLTYSPLNSLTHKYTGLYKVHLAFLLKLSPRIVNK